MCIFISELKTDLEEQETHGAGCVVGDATEVGGSRVEIGVFELRVVGDVERVHAVESVTADAIDTGGEDASLEVGGGPGGIAFKAINVDPTIKGAAAGVDVVQIAGAEDIAKIEQWAGLLRLARGKGMPKFTTTIVKEKDMIVESGSVQP